MKWLPQNDILGHPKTKLFLTHAGVNGMAEGAYHGVPMVCSPFSADQFQNCARIKEFGLGDIASVRDTTTEGLVEILKTVLSEKRLAKALPLSFFLASSLPSLLQIFLPQFSLPRSLLPSLVQLFFLKPWHRYSFNIVFHQVQRKISARLQSHEESYTYTNRRSR